MMILKDILKDIDTVSINGSSVIEISSIEFDSRKVSDGQLFIALKGTASDGHEYIQDAVSKGAEAILCEYLPAELNPNITYIQVADAHQALGRAAGNFYGNPSSKLKLVGITGTNGKTTTATLLYDLYTELGFKAGLISTVIYKIGDTEIESTHTTPDPIKLNSLLAEMVDSGCEYCFMEVSSHSIVQKRIEGLSFKGGVFTNITHDHLDYHGTFADYIKAKKAFFDSLPSTAFALVNDDDRNGSVMLQNTKASKYTFSLRKFSDFRGKIIETLFDGMLLNIHGEEVWVKFIGGFNAYNLLAVYATAILLGAEKPEVLRNLSILNPVNGRFEYIRSKNGVTAIVDYAHTPDALENVISTINELRTETQKLYTVVGCGGNRDKAKRPVMAKIAAENSNTAILTSDNPRNEDPADILEDMKKGLPDNSSYLVISDRREAIKTAAMLAKEGDIILIAGKGHENYQIIGDTKHHFDDKEEIKNNFGL